MGSRDGWDGGGAVRGKMETTVLEQQLKNVEKIINKFTNDFSLFVLGFKAYFLLNVFN